MTKREHEALQELFSKQYNESRKKEEKCFKELQDMSRSLGLSVWCSAKMNWEQLIKITEPYTEGGCNTTYARRADYIYEEYTIARGKEDSAMELGRTLAELNFWK